MSDTSQLAVAIARLDTLNDSVADLRAVVTDLAKAVGKLAVVEERQATDRASIERVFKALEKAGERLDALEQAQPIQKQSSDMVQKVVSAVIGAVLAAGLMGIVHQVKPPEPAIVERKH